VLNPIASHIEHYMDLLGARQKLVVSNVANAATPGFKTRDIDFQSEYANAVAGSPRPAEVKEVPGMKSGNDGNNVSLDREARLLSEIATRFNIAGQFWKAQYRATRAAIEEGRNG
jgi:flagellar basal-body rod protein FlgB